MEGNMIVGVWDLKTVTAIAEDLTEFHPFGSNPKGRIIYTENGYVSVVISSANRKPISGKEPLNGPVDELVEAFKSFDAYSGKYYIDYDNWLIYHETDIDRVPNYVPSVKIREVKLDGGLLTLTTQDRIPLAEKNWKVALVWERNE